MTVALATLIAGCGGHGGGGARPARVDRPLGGAVIVVGDSLAAGRFAGTQAEAFPQQVAAALHARLEVVGIPGATTAQLAAQPVPGRGNTVVVEAGTNDFLYQTPRRRFTNDYRALLARITAASPGAGLVCLTTWVPNDVASQPAARIPASFYDTSIRHACRAGAVADLSLLLAQPGLRGPGGRSTFLGPGDAFHPNSAGHTAIARLIESRLR